MDLRRSGLIPRNSLKAVDSIGTDIPAQFATDRSSVYGLAQAGWQLPQVAGRPRGRWLPDASGGRCDEHGAVLVLEGRDEVAAANLLRAWIERHGVPKALYTDWKNVYVREATESERLKGIAPVSQFGRMCARLGIGIVAANSPQAKGRVERAHGTHQDRLVKKLGWPRSATMSRPTGMSRRTIWQTTTGASRGPHRRRRTSIASGPRNGTWMRSSNSNRSAW